MRLQVTPFLMFDGTAEQAMTFYASIFEEFQLRSIEHYGADEPALRGKIRRAQFTLASVH